MMKANISLCSKEAESGCNFKIPGLVGGYEAYKAALARLEAIEAKGEFSIGFETKLQRPFGGSGYDSDESVGLVLRKTLTMARSLKVKWKGLNLPSICRFQNCRPLIVMASGW